LALHNVGLALSALRAAGVPLDAVPTGRGLAALKPDDIVDGDRDRTLALLWAAARALQLPRLLRAGTLKAEVARVVARGRRGGRRRLPGGGGAAGGPAKVEVPLAVYMNDELASLLLEWAQAVCAQWGVGVGNFTTAFGDGRVLCLLVREWGEGALSGAGPVWMQLGAE
jgi:abnormal spindle-like microcephaly-associated protein